MVDIAADLAMSLDPAEVFRRAIGRPDGWQEETLRSDEDALIVVTRQGGKSAAIASRATWTACYRPGSTVLCISPSQRQSGELFERIGATYKSIGSPVPIVAESAVRVRLANGSRVISLPDSPATIRGFTPHLVLIDEAARVSDETYVAVRPMVAVSGGRILCVSTPWSRAGFFYEAWKGDGDQMRVKIPATMIDRISPEFLAREKAAMTAAQFAREYMCEWSETIEGVFGEALIDSLFSEALDPLLIS